MGDATPAEQSLDRRLRTVERELALMKEELHRLGNILNDMALRQERDRLRAERQAKERG